MPNRPPPLNSLRAFEMAARHMSFIRAAKESKLYDHVKRHRAVP